MKSILIISYFFPPIRSAEGTIAANYVKYLKKFEWTSYVICGKPTKFDIIDGTTFNSDVKIYPIASFRNALMHLLQKLIKGKQLKKSKLKKADKKKFPSMSTILNFFIILPGRIYGWVPSVVLLSFSIIRGKKIDVIMSRSSPISSHIAGLIIHFFFRLPWIVCLSDPWTSDPNLPYKNKILPESIIKRYDEIIERKVIQRSTLVILTTEELRVEYLSRFNLLSQKKFVVIPNSFDKNEFHNINNSYKNKKFTLIYAGTFTNTRTPKSFFEALQLLKTRDPIVFSNIQIQLIGELGNIHELISRYKLENIISCSEKIPHNRVIEALNKSDILVLIDAPNHTMCLPSKLVEYIFFNKFILAITPENSTSAKLIRLTNTGLIVHPNDSKSIAENIERLFYLWKNDQLLLNPNWDEINKYSAENCTLILSKYIENMSNNKIYYHRST